MHTCMHVHTHAYNTHTLFYIFPFQFTEDGEPSQPEEGVEADMELLNYTNPLFQHGISSLKEVVLVERCAAQLSAWCP